MKYLGRNPYTEELEGNWKQRWLIIFISFLYEPEKQKKKEKKYKTCLRAPKTHPNSPIASSRARSPSSPLRSSYPKPQSIPSAPFASIDSSRNPLQFFKISISRRRYAGFALLGPLSFNFVLLFWDQRRAGLLLDPYGMDGDWGSFFLTVDSVARSVWVRALD